MELMKKSIESLVKYSNDFWHLPEWTNYCLTTGDTKCEEHTLVLVDRDESVKAIIPLIKDGEEFIFQKSFCPNILVDEGSINWTELTKQLKDYAILNGVKRIAINGYVPSFINHVQQVCVSTLIKSEVRKSYKSLMHSKLTTCEVINCASAHIPQAIKEAKEFYHLLATKRNGQTFVHYSNWIKNGLAFLVFARIGGELVGITLITYYKGSAYYFLSGYLTKCRRLNVGHAMQGAVFNELERLGIREYLLGDISMNNILECKDGKNRDINFFKSGFGEAKPQIVSEYFTCPIYMKQTMIKRMKTYIGAELHEGGNIISKT